MHNNTNMSKRAHGCQRYYCKKILKYFCQKNKFSYNDGFYEQFFLQLVVKHVDY
jgi:hypothetical protein